MKLILAIIIFFIATLGHEAFSFNNTKEKMLQINYYGDTIKISIDTSGKTIAIVSSLSDSSVQAFFNTINNGDFEPVIDTLIAYKKKYGLDDWLYYQLIRSTAECISPKLKNYQQYTLIKWFLLVKSGYATNICIRNDRLLLYVKSNEEVYNIPFIMKDNDQYVCLNYHDYGSINFEKERFTSLNISIPQTEHTFSFKVNNLPDFKNENYQLKELRFDYYRDEHRFKVMFNKQIKTIFKNYPVVDYATYFNIPLSKLTYSSLIPLLRENVKRMNQKDGVDYLMRFTRYAFTFGTDTKNFGSEKRLSPEQTLTYESSDCEDRAALFFYLVREIYNLPMIVLSYPEHVNVAVQFDKPLKNPINFKGNNYWICDPTPQSFDLKIGESLPVLKKTAYDVVYAYHPNK